MVGKNIQTCPPLPLDKIDGMHFLHSVYKQVLTTPEIAAEYGKRLPDWVDGKAVLKFSDVDFACEFNSKGSA